METNTAIKHDNAGTETIRLSVTGMHCGSCVSRVENLLLDQPGVIGARANLANHSASVDTIVGDTSAGQLADLLTRAGYESQFHPTDSESLPSTQRESTSHTNLLFAILLATPVFILEMGSHVSPTFASWIQNTIGLTTSHWIQLVLSAIVVFVTGREFFLIGIPALLRAAPEMNTLVAIGASAAWFFSAINTLLPNALSTGHAQVYFESAAVIVALILLGRYLESKARGKTTIAIATLAKLQPDSALLLHDGVAAEVALQDIQPGDHIQIKPGSRIPLDGTVLAGSSHVDESMLTGEPMQVVRSVGDPVTGGSLNADGVLTVQVNATGSDTVLAGIMTQVQDAQNTKLPIQALVDKVAMWFVPAVLGIAAATFCVWYFLGSGDNRFETALIYAVSVLVIACPCAMGLATPMSVMVGIGRAATVGLLFRNGQALQQLGQVQTMALDKTGTLTIGRPVVTHVKSVIDGLNPDQLLALVASAQTPSEHPTAHAVVQAANERGLKVVPCTDFIAHPGRGICALVGSDTVHAGNESFLRQHNIDTASLRQYADERARIGESVFMVAINHLPAGVIALADEIRSETPAALKSLRQQGIELAIISGDRTETVSRLATKLDIANAFGNVLPADKQATVKKLRHPEQLIAFVGDGINDAPALAAADVGIAIGSGTDVAIESADVVLASSDLSNLARGVHLSRATLINIKQNLFWAFIYNLVLIPIAAGALAPSYGISLSPMLAAGAMAFSSVFVVLNALRLNRLELK